MQSRMKICFSALVSFLLICYCLPQLIYAETLNFGPEFYTRGRGKPQKVTKNFSVQNPDAEFTLNVQQGDGKKERVSSALIEINDVKVIGPEEFSKQTVTITRAVKLKKDNTIAVELRSEPGSSIVVSILGPDAFSVTRTITPEGGTVTLEGYASVTFPSGAMPANTDVTVSATSTAETEEDFSFTAEIDAAGPRLPYEIRINTGGIMPSNAFDLVVQVPVSFITTLPPNSAIDVFVQLLHESEHEVIDHFYYGFPSTFNPNSMAVIVTLPKEVFTNQRHIEDTYEAVIIVGVIPTL